MSKRSVFINGDIYLTAGGRKAEALAAENGIITEIGTNARLRPLARRGFELIDLKGRCIIPGIIDSHLHMLSLGNLFKRVNLDGLDSLDKVKSAIKIASSKLEEGQWLRGRGWNKNLWGESFPDKSVLDGITDHPVALGSKDGHLLWVNSKALLICGIDKDTADPAGGEITRGESGNPTGILKENALELVFNKIPPQSYFEKRKALLAAQERLLSLGITGVGDCDTDPSLITIYQNLDSAGDLRLRVFKMIEPSYLERAREMKLKTGSGTGHLRTGSLKLFSDGALGSQTAFMFRPFNRSGGNRGIETLTPDQMEDFIRRAGEIGISTAIHAIGDKANYQALQAYGNLFDRFSRNGLRQRIEHAQVLRREDIPLFAKHGVTASVQPIHVTSDRDISDRYLGARGKYAYPFKTLLRSKAQLAFGSDSPIETANPFAGIHAAVTRRRANESRGSWYPEERLTVSEALRAYTTGSARACFFDDLVGGIESGRRADFAVLSDDVFKVKPGKIHQIEVLATFIDGVPAHDSGFL